MVKQTCVFDSTTNSLHKHFITNICLFLKCLNTCSGSTRGIARGSELVGQCLSLYCGKDRHSVRSSYNEVSRQIKTHSTIDINNQILPRQRYSEPERSHFGQSHNQLLNTKSLLMSTPIIVWSIVYGNIFVGSSCLITPCAWGIVQNAQTSMITSLKLNNRQSKNSQKCLQR